MIARFMLGGFWGPRAPQDGPRAIQTSFFRLQEPPRELQEAIKMLLEGFRVEDAIGNQFWNRFGLVFGGPGLSKLRFSCERYCDFCDFAIFNQDPILDPILDPPGDRFGSLLAPKIAETSLGIPLGAPKSRSKDLFFGPGGVQERSKRPAGGQNKAPCFGTVLGTALGGGPPPNRTILGCFRDAILEKNKPKDKSRKPQAKPKVKTQKPSQKLKAQIQSKT